MVISMFRPPLQWDMASPHSDMLRSPPSLMSTGKREAVQTDHRKKIGSTRRKICDPALASVDPVRAPKSAANSEDCANRRRNDDRVSFFRPPTAAPVGVNRMMRL